MSRAAANAAGSVTDINFGRVDVDVNTRGGTFDVDYSGNNKYSVDASNNTSYKFVEFDSADPGSWSKVDMSDPVTRKNIVASIKKMESDSYTAQFSDVITSSTFYKNNKGKLAAMGITVAGAAGWFGVLLAMGYTPQEAWAIMKETAGNFANAILNAAGDAGGAGGKWALGALWGAFVQAVHSAVGYKYFDDVDGTGKALKTFFVFLIMYKILGFFGINLVTLPFKVIFKLVGKLIKR